MRQEIAIIAELNKYRSKIGEVIEALDTKRIGSRENILDLEIAQYLQKEFDGFRYDFLKHFNEEHKQALESAVELIYEARKVLQNPDNELKGSNDPKMSEKLGNRLNVKRNLKSARVIINLVWQAQPRKTYDDFMGSNSESISE